MTSRSHDAQPDIDSPSKHRLAGNARDLALQVTAEIRAEWSYATDIMSRAFRVHRGLASRDRRLVAETVYGLLRMDRRLDAQVDELPPFNRGPKRTLTPMMRDQAKLLFWELGQQIISADTAAAELKQIVGYGVPAERICDADFGLGKKQGLEREAIRHSFPTWMLERFVEDLGEAEALKLAASMNERAPLMVMTNTRLITREDLIARLALEGVQAEPTALAPTGLLFRTRVNAFALPSFQEGLFEVMDEGSQLVAEAVAPPPGGRVVDACAGAGGKTLALGALMQGKGRLFAMDVAGKKLEELRRRARRAGLSNVAARAVEGVQLPPEARAEAWDRVLVDAPCSGLGTLRRNPEARWRLTPSDVARFPSLQLSLLVAYAPLVAVGGRLIFATCTVLRSENELVIEAFLKERPEFVPVPLKEVMGKARAETLGDGDTLRLFPHRQGTDGFFTAVMRRVR
ncbi:MAG: class I SAM-dependent methyltransferase [Deltaproteobacteria bacterium]|nr:class I SAM-dependent methyltransferase [Deltaproteobacteria bacterium]